MKKATINVLFQDYDREDIDSVIKVLGEIKTVLQDLRKEDERLKQLVLDFLKKNNWEKYYSKQNKVSVSVITKSKEVVNKKVLNLLLNETQISNVITKKKKKELIVITDRDRKKLKEFS